MENYQSSNSKKIEGSKVPATTSLEIAEIFGKEHKDVLESIDKLINTGKFDQRNFSPIKYKDAGGRTYRAYALDEKIALTLIMGFTGEKALDWKIKYLMYFFLMRFMFF